MVTLGEHVCRCHNRHQIRVGVVLHQKWYADVCHVQGDMIRNFQIGSIFKFESGELKKFQNSKVAENSEVFLGSKMEDFGD
jgi:hypothetical protein